MKMTIEEVHRLLRERKSVYPQQFINKEIPRQLLLDILESANWAPTHKLTEPWRYKVFVGEGRKKLGTFLAEKYRAVTPAGDFSIARYEKLKTNPQKAGCVLAICLQVDPQKRVPEWEELAAVAASVQNIWLSAYAQGIGGYWSTPDLIQHLGELVPMNTGERCIGLFYLGYYAPFETARKRGSIHQKLTWVE